MKLLNKPTHVDKSERAGPVKLFLGEIRIRVNGHDIPFSSRFEIDRHFFACNLLKSFH